MHGATMGELTRRRGEWLVAVARALELTPDCYVLVPSPSGREAIVRLTWRVGASLRFEAELWRFETVWIREPVAPPHDVEALRLAWAREVERLWRETPMRVIDLIITRKRRRRRMQRSTKAPVSWGQTAAL